MCYNGRYEAGSLPIDGLLHLIGLH